jgi:hypothetical protein
MSQIPRRFLFILAVATFLAGLTAGCAGGPENAAGHGFPMADLAHMPAEVQAAPVAVQQAYQFAEANPEILQEVPCYCGCGAMGHTSNYDCYIAGVNEAGTLAYDEHALGCSICVDITQDTMRLMRQGKSLQEIRTYIDETYARYGPSNIPG